MESSFDYAELDRRIWNSLPDILPEFEFTLYNGNWRSTTTDHLKNLYESYTRGGTQRNKVFCYKDSFHLYDFRDNGYSVRIIEYYRKTRHFQEEKDAVAELCRMTYLEPPVWASSDTKAYQFKAYTPKFIVKQSSPQETIKTNEDGKQALSDAFSIECNKDIQHTLKTFLIQKFNPIYVDKVFELYGITGKEENGNNESDKTCFWYFDKELTCYAAKVIQYKPDGHRTGSIFHESKNITQNKDYEPVKHLYGIHLLNQRMELIKDVKTINIVESEKTAAICMMHYIKNGRYDTIFLATGGAGGIKNALPNDIDFLKSLKVDICLVRDNDETGRKWEETALKYGLPIINVGGEEKRDYGDLIIDAVSEELEEMQRKFISESSVKQYERPGLYGDVFLLAELPYGQTHGIRKKTT